MFFGFDLIVPGTRMKRRVARLGVMEAHAQHAGSDGCKGVQWVDASSWILSWVVAAALGPGSGRFTDQLINSIRRFIQ